MKRNLCHSLMAIALMAAPALGQSLHPQHDLQITPVSGGFLVENDGENGARGMWCAAGVHAKASGAGAPQQRIYVAEARTPGLGQRDPVKFTLDPSGLTPQSVLLIGASFRQAGTSMSVQHALSLCHALRGNGR
jgi:hypothetical protein